MNTKEEGIISSLKEISELESEIAKEAMADREHGIATHSMIVATITAEAAEIIAKQAAELDLLKARGCQGTSDIGSRIFIASSVSQEHIIIAELSSKYLITPTPIRESALLANIRLIDRDQAVFIDRAQHVEFNA